MNKRIISIITIVVIVVAFTFIAVADTNIVDSMNFQIQGSEMTLDDAIAAMLQDNPDLLKSSLELEQARVDYEKSERDLRKIKQAFTLRDVGSIDYLQSVTLFEVSAKFSLANAERSYEATKIGLQANIEEAYYGLLQAEQQKQISEEDMAVARDLYEKTQKKFELGLVAKQEVLNAELNYINSQNAVRAAETGVKSAKMAFNSKLGFNVMTDIKLKDELRDREFEAGSIAEVVKKAFDNRLEIKALEYAYQVADINMKIAKVKFTDAMTPYKYADIDLKKAERDLGSGRSGIEMEVRINYIDVQQKKEEIKAGEKSVVLAQEALNISKATYDAGMGLFTDVQKAQVSLQQAKLGLSKSILDYNLAVLKFEDSMGVGRRNPSAATGE